MQSTCNLCKVLMYLQKWCHPLSFWWHLNPVFLNFYKRKVKRDHCLISYTRTTLNLLRMDATPTENKHFCIIEQRNVQLMILTKHLKAGMAIKCKKNEHVTWWVSHFHRKNLFFSPVTEGTYMKFLPHLLLFFVLFRQSILQMNNNTFWPQCFYKLSWLKLREISAL